MTRILITGGAGFIGSHVQDALLEQGHHVVVMDNLVTGTEKNLNKKAVFYNCDIVSPEAEVVFAKEQPEVVFHFAAHIEARESAKNPLYDANVNILGSIHILELCRKHKIKKIIFASSGGEVYGNATTIPTSEEYVPAPLSPYGIAKFAVEKYLIAYQTIYKLPFVALRFGNVYGPRQNPKGEAGVIAIFAAKMLTGGKPLIHGDGKQTKDYVFIDDVVQAALLSLPETATGIFNIATGKENSVMEIFQKLKEATGSDAAEEHVDFPAIGFARGCLSIEKAKKELGFAPQYDLDAGLQKTVAWFKENT